VANLAIQRGDTRWLLQRGLQQLQRAPRPGVAALIKKAAIDPDTLDADSIGFQLGPRLNAAGRMATAGLSVQLLTTEDPGEAAALADQIEGLNVARREKQKEVEAEAFAQIEKDPTLAEYPVVVLYGPEWPGSIIGIVASAIVDRFNRPAILIAQQGAQSPARGSARGVEGIDIHAAIAAQTDLIVSSGGHPMAAGVVIDPANVDAFREAVGRHVAEQLATAREKKPDAPEDRTDVFDVAWGEASLGLADQIERLAPFGPGNPRPILRSEPLTLARFKPLGKDGKHQAVLLKDVTGKIQRAIWWRSAGQTVAGDETPLSATFTLKRNVYRGRAREQLEIVTLNAISIREPVQATVNDTFVIHDLRQQPGAALDALLATVDASDILHWRTGQPVRAAPFLCLWDAPPDRASLKALLRAITPRVVVLLVGRPSLKQDSPAYLLAVAREMAEKAIESVARKIGHRVETLQAARDVLGAKPGAHARLTLLLAETRGFRLRMAEAPADQALQ
jgi:RecJ OB domain/DHHA1 domain